jgi:hypothetical protein
VERCPALELARPALPSVRWGAFPHGGFLESGTTSWAHVEVMLEQERVTGTTPEHARRKHAPCGNDGPTGKTGKEKRKESFKERKKTVPGPLRY